MNMTIRMKLAMGFGFIIVMLVLLVGVIRFKSTESNSTLYKSTGAVELSLSLGGEIHHALSAQRGYMMLGLPALAQEHVEAWGRVDGYLAEMDELAKDWEDRDLINEYADLKEVLADFRAVQQRIADVAWTESDLHADVQNIAAPLASEAGELITHIAERQSELKDASVEQYEASKASILHTVETFGISAIVASSLIAIFLSGSITRRLTSVMRYATQIADRDLSMDDLEMKSSDEIGKLARTINDMKNAIRQVVSDVAGATQAVASSSAELAASAEEMAVGLHTQERQTQQVAAAVEELSQSVGEVAAKSADATTASEESQHLAEEGGLIVTSTVEEMRGIATEVQSSADAINTLGHKSQTIGEIIAVINDIADQTNLLALNAAIEAARAGEHGRGFAVVADEVRKLAERTTDATEKVSISIRGIQSETKTAVELIESGSKRVGRGVDLASQAGVALQSIVSGSQGLQSMVQDIAAAANQQTAAAEEIARSVEGINSVTAQSSEGAAQASQAAGDLAMQAEQLQGLVARFKLN